MTHYRKLVGKKCYLSPCSVEDASKWTEWDNDLEVAIPLGDEVYCPTSEEKQKQILEDIIKKQSHIFNIVSLDNDELIGRCMFFALSQIDRCAMLGIVIGEKEYWDKGIGTEAAGLLLDYGFNILNLNSVMLGVFEFNKRAIRSYEKLGFKRIGNRRQGRIIAGKKYDVVLMDILAEEFESPVIKDIIKGINKNN